RCSLTIRPPALKRTPVEISAWRIPSSPPHIFWTPAGVILSVANQESSMPADSDSTIAWHRVQLKKLRQTLKDIETSRFTVGESAYANRTGKTRQTIADLQRKIDRSLRVI